MKRIQQRLTLESRRLGRWEAKTKELKGTQAMTLGRGQEERVQVSAGGSLGRVHLV